MIELPEIRPPVLPLLNIQALSQSLGKFALQ